MELNLVTGVARILLWGITALMLYGWKHRPLPAFACATAAIGNIAYLFGNTAIVGEDKMWVAVGGMLGTPTVALLCLVMLGDRRVR